jgi:hypothetical protein
MLDLEVVRGEEGLHVVAGVVVPAPLLLLRDHACPLAASGVLHPAAAASPSTTFLPSASPPRHCSSGRPICRPRVWRRVLRYLLIGDDGTVNYLWELK